MTAALTRVVGLLLAVLVLGPAAALAQPSPRVFDTDVTVLLDGTGTLDVNAVAAFPASRFTPLDGIPADTPPDGVYWLRAAVPVDPGPTGAWIVEIGTHFYDRIDLYATAGGAAGAPLPLPRRSYAPRSGFFLARAHAPEVTLLARVVPGAAATTLPAALWPAAAFEAASRRDQLVLGLLYGALLVMVLYNLALYLAIRDSSLLYYAGFTAALAGSFVVWDGLAREYLWPASPHLNRAAATSLDGLTALGAALFARSYLTTSEAARRVDAALIGVGLLGLATIALSAPAVWTWSDAAAGVTALVGPPILLLAGVMRLRAGYRPARYYLIALSLVAVGLTAETAATYLMPAGPTVVSTYGTYAGAVAMVVLFSLGLADRYNESLRRQERVTAENRALQEFSFRDGLTGLYNRRAFDAQLADEWRRGARARAPLSLVMVDVDHFKAYNDSRGHQAGDRCLRDVARALAGVARRPGDLVARYGGEEFVALLASGDADGGRIVAEAMRAAVAGLGLAHAAPGVGDTVTISAGVATLTPDEGIDATALVERADQALYRAKRAGRNRVVLFDEPDE